MKKQEALKMIKAQKETIVEMTGWAVFKYIKTLIEQLDEPETGHADEAPRYVKNILARLRELPEHDREVWLKAIMGEFEQDFSSAKWREGYEQGKFEGKYIPEKVVVPQFVADWYEEHKKDLGYSIWNYIYYWDQQEGYDFKDWFDYGCCGTIQTLFNMHQFGYTVEKEPKYIVKLKGVVRNSMVLKHNINEDTWYMSNKTNYTDLKSYHTRKELEEGGFGEVFDSPLFEIEEVEE